MRQLELVEPDVFVGPAVPGRIDYHDPVITIVSDNRRWDFVAGRDTIPSVLSYEPADHGAFTLRLSMEAGDDLHILVETNHADAGYRALAVLRSFGVAAEEQAPRQRWHL